MVQRAAVAQRNADHRLLRRGGRLADRFRHFARLAVAEAGAALAVADDDQRREAEALAALHRLGDAVDVDELLDQLLAAVVVAATAAATIVATATAAAAIAAATATAATAAAPPRGPRPCGLLRLLGRLLLGLGRSRFGSRAALRSGRCRLRWSAFSSSHSRTPVRLRGQRRRGPSPGHGTGSRHGRTRPLDTPAFLARSASVLPTAAAPSRGRAGLALEVLVEGRGRRRASCPRHRR